MRVSHAWALGLALLLSCGAATADIVYLTNGRSIEGKVTVKDGKVIVEKPDGVVILDASKVDRIEKKESLVEAYEKQLAAIDEKAGGAAAKFAELGQWARSRDMDNQAEACFLKAIELDADHAAARAGLGYTKHDGKWMTEDELQQARGMVRHGDAWVTPEAKADLERLQALTELERTRAETERLRLERAELEKERAELAREEQGDVYPYRSYGGVIYGGYVVSGSGYPRPPHTHRPPATRSEPGVHPDRTSPSANLPQAHYKQTPRGLKLAPPPPAPPPPPEEPAP
ncbi:MAG: hypothetical protein IT564_12950 [Rhodospirillales bacterium]|nr:hypothetical protein [Rhodospirillales bacterium]